MPTKLEMENLKFIPIGHVPRRQLYTVWNELFDKIPAGQALVFSEDELKLDTVSGALRRMKRRGLYGHLRSVIRTVKGKRHIYMMNEKEPKRVE